MEESNYFGTMFKSFLPSKIPSEPSSSSKHEERTTPSPPTAVMAVPMLLEEAVAQNIDELMSIASESKNRSIDAIEMIENDDGVFDCDAPKLLTPNAATISFSKISKPKLSTVIDTEGDFVFDEDKEETKNTVFIVDAERALENKSENEDRRIDGDDGTRGNNHSAKKETDRYEEDILRSYAYFNSSYSKGQPKQQPRNVSSPQHQNSRNDSIETTETQSIDLSSLLCQQYNLHQDYSKRDSIYHVDQVIIPNQLDPEETVCDCSISIESKTLSFGASQVDFSVMYAEDDKIWKENSSCSSKANNHCRASEAINGRSNLTNDYSSGKSSITSKSDTDIISGHYFDVSAMARVGNNLFRESLLVEKDIGDEEEVSKFINKTSCNFSPPFSEDLTSIAAKTQQRQQLKSNRNRTGMTLMSIPLFAMFVFVHSTLKISSNQIINVGNKFMPSSNEKIEGLGINSPDFIADNFKNLNVARLEPEEIEAFKIKRTNNSLKYDDVANNIQTIDFDRCYIDATETSESKKTLAIESIVEKHLHGFSKPKLIFMLFSASTFLLGLRQILLTLLTSIVLSGNKLKIVNSSSKASPSPKSVARRSSGSDSRFLTPSSPLKSCNIEPTQYMSPLYGDSALDVSRYKVMKYDELRRLLRKRKADARGSKENLIRHLLTVVQADLSCFTVEQLRPKLRLKNLPQNGTKEDIIRRLIENGVF